MIVTEQELLSGIQQWIESVDSYDLERLASEMFGGKWESIDGDHYRLTPDQDYEGAFGEEED